MCTSLAWAEDRQVLLPAYSLCPVQCRSRYKLNHQTQGSLARESSKSWASCWWWNSNLYKWLVYAAPSGWSVSQERPRHAVLSDNVSNPLWIVLHLVHLSLQLNLAKSPFLMLHSHSQSLNECITSDGISSQMQKKTSKGLLPCQIILRSN